MTVAPHRHRPSPAAPSATEPATAAITSQYDPGMTGHHETDPCQHVHATSLDGTIRRLGKPRPTVSAGQPLQSVLAGVFVAVEAGVAVVVELEVESLDDGVVDDVSPEVVDEVEDDFDLPPRLSVL